MSNSRTYFTIFGMPRSGSTWLMTMIDEHPDAVCFEELFYQTHLQNYYAWVSSEKVKRLFTYKEETGKSGPKAISDYFEYLEDFNPTARVRGFKLMYGQYYRQPSLTWHMIKKRMRILVIVRENAFENVMSVLVKNAMGNGHGTGAAENIPKITVDIPAFKKELWKKETIVPILKLFGALFPCPSLVVSYEELSRDSNKVMQGVFAFLGLSPQTVKGKTGKRVQTPYEEIIENYDEVYAVLKDTNRLHYLENKDA